MSGQNKIKNDAVEQVSDDRSWAKGVLVLPVVLCLVLIAGIQIFPSAKLDLATTKEPLRAGCEYLQDGVITVYSTLPRGATLDGGSDLKKILRIDAPIVQLPQTPISVEAECRLGGYSFTYFKVENEDKYVLAEKVTVEKPTFPPFARCETDDGKFRVEEADVRAFKVVYDSSKDEYIPTLESSLLPRGTKIQASARCLDSLRLHELYRLSSDENLYVWGSDVVRYVGD